MGIAGRGQDVRNVPCLHQPELEVERDSRTRHPRTYRSRACHWTGEGPWEVCVGFYVKTNQAGGLSYVVWQEGLVLAVSHGLQYCFIQPYSSAIHAAIYQGAIRDRKKLQKYDTDIPDTSHRRDSALGLLKLRVLVAAA